MLVVVFNYVVFNIVNVLGLWFGGMVIGVGFSLVIIGYVGVVMVLGGLLLWGVVMLVEC